MLGDQLVLLYLIAIFVAMMATVAYYAIYFGFQLFYRSVFQAPSAIAGGLIVGILLMVTGAVCAFFAIQASNAYPSDFFFGRVIGFWGGAIETILISTGLFLWGPYHPYTLDSADAEMANAPQDQLDPGVDIRV